MVRSATIPVKNNDILLLVGTMKGLFLFRSNTARRRWDVGGSFFPGRSVYGAAYDGREGRHRIWAAPASMHWGAELCSSDDFGKHWDQPETPRIRFPETAGASLANIWQIAPGPPQEPDTLYCGVEPAALFESRDAGKTWAFNEGLWNHPHRSPMGAGRRGPLSAHDPRGPGRPRAPNRRRFGGRRLPLGRRRANLGVAQLRRPRGIPARQASRVRPVRPQDRPSSHPPGQALPAEPLGPLPKRRRRRLLARHRPRGPVRLRVLHGDAPGRSRHGLHPSDRIRRVPLCPGGKAAGLPDARRRALLEADDAGPAAEERLRDRSPRRYGHGPARPRRRLFWGSPRGGLRPARPGGVLGSSGRRA